MEEIKKLSAQIAERQADLNSVMNDVRLCAESLAKEDRLRCRLSELEDRRKAIKGEAFLAKTDPDPVTLQKVEDEIAQLRDEFKMLHEQNEAYEGAAEILSKREESLSIEIGLLVDQLTCPQKGYQPSVSKILGCQV